MSRSPFRSPWTGDSWPNTRCAIGVIAAVAMGLRNRWDLFTTDWPRERAPDGYNALIERAGDVARIAAGLPKITSHGVEGKSVSDLYWAANEANAAITAFRELHGWNHQTIVGAWYWEHPAETMPTRQVSPYEVSMTLARLAMLLAQRVASDRNADALDEFSASYNAVKRAVWEVAHARIAPELLVDIERHWRFMIAAGRMPKLPDDDDLLAAFEAAISVGEFEFANQLVRE